MSSRVLDECRRCQRSGVHHHARGLCNTCYSRALRTGRLHQYPPMPPLPPPPREHRAAPRIRRCTLVGNRGEPADPIEVRLCLTGQVAARDISSASRAEVVRIMAARRHSDAEIERITGWFKHGGRPGVAVCKFRARKGIPAGRPEYGRRRAA